MSLIKFITFTDIDRKGKRSRLVGKHVFITSSDKPWQEFMNVIPNIYNLSVKTLLISNIFIYILHML